MNSRCPEAQHRSSCDEGSKFTSQYVDGESFQTVLNDQENRGSPQSRERESGAGPENTRETVEEVLAVVGSTPILYSDINLAESVKLVEQNKGESEEDLRSRLLDARIRLEVQFQDLESSGQLYRIDLEPMNVRESLINRGGGEQSLGRQISAAGLSWSDLDELVLRISAVDAYVEQRLRPRVSVSFEEIEAAYRRLLVEEFAENSESAPPLNAVSDQIHALLVERKLNIEIERWLEQANERQALTRFSR